MSTQFGVPVQSAFQEFFFFFFFYIQITLHLPNGMAGRSQRLTNTCAAYHHGSLYKGTEQTIG